VLTTVPITARVLHIKHGALAPKTDLASCDLPELPVFMSMSGEYDVASPDGQVKGLFFCQNVM
jgi:hypothetical protein